jgi:nicotinamidase-related amidase
VGLIDPEHAVFPQLGKQVERRGIVEKIATLAATCRECGVPIVHAVIQLLPGAQAFQVCCKMQALMRRAEKLQQTRPECQIHPGLRPVETDIVCRRMHGITAFYGTELESILRGLKADTVILTGVSTNVAIPGNAIEAVNRGFAVVIPEDCTAGATQESHEFTIREILPLLAAVTQLEALVAVLRRRAGTYGGNTAPVAC